MSIKEFYRFLSIQKTECNDSILHDSAVGYSIFCGSLFSPAVGLRLNSINQINLINSVNLINTKLELSDKNMSYCRP